MLQFEKRLSIDGQCYFVIQAGNNEVLVTSETYLEERDCDHAIGLIREGAATAELVTRTVDL